jgi:hypothetical protein
MEWKNWLKRRVGWKNKPVREVRHRVRKSGWIVCECPDCNCKDPSRWEDNLCIACFRGMHKSNIGVKEED